MAKQLTNDWNANPSHRTKVSGVYESHRSVRQEGDQEPRTHWLYVSDYPGQNVGELIRWFVAEQKIGYSPMAYGHVTSLVLVVDVRSPKESKTDPDPKIGAPEEDRIALHLEQWSETAIQALFGLFTDSLKFVCLFVNKFDIVQERAQTTVENCVAKFDPLRDRIERLCREFKTPDDGQVEFQVLHGSARTNEGLGELIQQFVRTSYDPRGSGS